MRKINLMLVLAMTAVFALSIACYAESLNDWEKGVFQDLAEKWHSRLDELPGDQELQKSDFENIRREVADKYNISVDQVLDIDSRGLEDDSDLGDMEYKLIDELDSRLHEAHKSSSYSWDQYQAIHNETASKYGISLYRLHWIEYKMYEGFWFF